MIHTKGSIRLTMFDDTHDPLSLSPILGIKFLLDFRIAHCIRTPKFNFPTIRRLFWVIQTKEAIETTGIYGLNMTGEGSILQEARPQGFPPIEYHQLT